MKKIKITQVKSGIDRSERQKLTLKALGVLLGAGVAEGVGIGVASAAFDTDVGIEFVEAPRTLFPADTGVGVNNAATKVCVILAALDAGVSVGRGRGSRYDIL